MPAGSLDDDPGVRPSAHVHVGSKANWHEITDDVPRFDAAPREFAELTDCAPTKSAARGSPHASCLCGGVAYEVAGVLDTIHNCLCSRDRKATGSAHDSCLHVPNDAVRVLRGRELVKSYKVPDAEYFTTQFCSVCGSPAPLPPGPSGDADMCMAAGIFDVALSARVVCWIFEGSKAPWFEVTGPAPRFEEHPPEDFDWR
ncbi:MAG: GFA family protein [Candidatus Binataceae bacterium]